MGRLTQEPGDDIEDTGLRHVDRVLNIESVDERLTQVVCERVGGDKCKAESRAVKHVNRRAAPHTSLPTCWTGTA